MIFYSKALLLLKQLYVIICAINYNTLIPKYMLSHEQ